MKFAVGAMLTTFGTFWGAEGAGARWPGGDAALPVLLASTTHPPGGCWPYSGFSFYR